MRPTRVRTESRTSLLRSASRSAGGRHWEKVVRLGTELHGSQRASLRAFGCSTYSSCSVGVDESLRRRVPLRGVGDGVRHDEG